MTVGNQWASRFEQISAQLALVDGDINGLFTVNKFGRSTNVDNGVATDIWDLTSQPIWVAPTQARIHNIKSTSASDDGDPVGVGARTVRIFGLTSWDTPEVSEDVTLNGTGDVATENAYVIIHRLIVLTNGATNINVGTITATAVTDATITAQINPGEGQTQMAIYGVPSVQDAYMTQYYASFNKSAGVTGAADISLDVNPDPDIELPAFGVKHTAAIMTSGSSWFLHPFYPYFKIPGPAILKMQGNGSANDLDISAGFDLILKTR